MIRNYLDLEDRLRTQGEKPVLGVVCGHDMHSLEAVKHALDRDLIEVVLVGIEQKIRGLMKELELADDAVTIVDCVGDRETAELAVQMVREKKLDFLMKGKIQTRDFLKAVVNSETGIKKRDILSMVMMIEMPSYHKVLAVTDGGMMIRPNLEEKVAILENAVDLFHSLGYERPKVGALAAVEVVNPKMQETVDADAIKKMNLPGCFVEGPIAYDLAFSKESAEIKGFESEIVEDADILLVPDIASGNILSKALIYSAGGKMAGTVLGAEVPIVLTSRGSSAYEKYNSIVLAALNGAFNKTL